MSTKPDTRQIPDDILQAAIDAAFIANLLTGFDASEFQPGWTSQSTHRLALARELLAHLIAVARDGQGEVVDWKAKYEAENRAHDNALEAIKKLRDRAEKAEAELASIVAAAHEAGWNGVENSKDLARFIKDLAQDADELEQRTIEQARKIIEGSTLPQLRPIAEAGPVPDGCVRYHFKKHDNGVWSVGTLAKTHGDSHFADIRLPSPAASQDSQPAEADPYAELKKAHAEGKVIESLICGKWREAFTPTWDYPIETYRIKPEPTTFEAHGKTWTRHTPGDPMPCDGEAFVDCFCEGGGTLHATRAKLWSWSGDIIGWRYADEPAPAPAWQPAVGEPVRLVSGGPVMAVNAIESNGMLDVIWISPDGYLQSASLAAACLTPAQEVQP